jgi:hypothetical protein
MIQRCHSQRRQFSLAYVQAYNHFHEELIE